MSRAAPRGLRSLFRAETGLRFAVWRQQVRLSRALELLAAGSAVTTAALESGYNSTSAFVAAFRAAFGRTPGRYFR